MPSAGGEIAVLVVEERPIDEESNTGGQVSDRLARHSDQFAVETAVNTNEALARLESRSVDCIVAGYDTAALTGIEFLEAVRETHPDLPFVMYTGRGNETVASEAIAAGVTDYVRSDIETGDIDTLVTRIEAAVAPTGDDGGGAGDDGGGAGDGGGNTEEDGRSTGGERNRDEKAKLLDAIFDQIPAHLYLKDEEGRHLRVSQHICTTDPNPALRVPTFTRDHIIGRRDIDIVDNELAEQSYADDMEVIETGEPIIDKEEYAPNIDTWFLTSKVPWVDESGSIQGLIGISRDITERKEAQRELARQNERLEEFAGVISHDLRNPLNVAQGRIKLAREECENEHLEHVERAHERMAELIDDLLVLAREGRQATETEVVALADLWESCWQNVDTKGATARVDTDRAVRANRSRLAQLVENLVRNAVEHGGAGVTITMGDLETGFYVADDGPGIDPDDQADVLSPGYSTSDQGTGFGLSITQQVAEAHGWALRVTESDHGGARFEVVGVEFADSSEQ